MSVLLLGSMGFSDLPQHVKPRVHLSEAVGNRLIKHQVQAKCPLSACAECRGAEVEAKVAMVTSWSCGT